ncbi:hypothetical protein MLD38_001930 [Melastoma candidum]|uniref:Uncharacterized protein n=1 Tax=Melastoma candidum TaxID=119954 RepID=A0ACB9SIR9_9MYRT|nr:hypothetical protein MLD38_001930 [Melastoma candidum]
MEGNMSQGGMIPGNPSYGGLDLQRSVQMQSQGHSPHQLHQHHSHGRQTSMVHPSVHDAFPLTMGTLQSCDPMMPMGDFNKGERCKNLGSDDDDRSLTEDGDGQSEMNKGKKGSPWQRVKWTDKMVRLLITAVSYIGEDASSESSGGSRRKFAVLQKKGKWKSISKVLAERGYHVSPQQCEDKFNDLNKRYKKLNDMLGRGTSCQVVEKPALLDVIDFLSEKEKDDVRKILSSKHLFYEEMCSYHNNNRLHLPHDPALQHSLQQALRSRDDQDHPDVRRGHHDDFDEDDLDLENDDRDDYEENHPTIGEGRGNCGHSKNPLKRGKQVHEEVGYGTSLNIQGSNKSFHSHSPVLQPDMNQPCPDNSKAVWFQKQWVESRTLQLEEQKMQIQMEMLELEKQRFKWERFCRKRDRELEKLKVENEKMKLENERMALELRRKEMSYSFS